MHRFEVRSVVKARVVLPLVVVIVMALGTAQATEAGSSPATPRSADTSQPAQPADAAQTAADQTASTPDASAPAPADQVKTLPGVSVTGTRIPQPSLTGSAALQSISANEIQLQGVVNVDQLLSNVPSAATLSSSNTDSENSASTVGLRGFGANRTLVLINGTRLVPGDPAAFNTAATDINGANLNFIPTALVERVEVLTGGASAIYGSDAIAGVVNFIMKQDFEGFSFDAQGTQSGHGDGTTYSPTVLWGANTADGKGNVTLYASYTQQSVVPLVARKFSSCPYLPDATGNGRECFGASSIKEGNFTSLDRPFGDNNVMVDPNGTHTFVPYDGHVYNFDLEAYLVRPARRYNFGGFAHHTINDHFEVYGSAMFMEDKNRARSNAPQLNFAQVDINCSNPFLSAQQRSYLCINPGQTQASTLVGRRFAEMGPRNIESNNTGYRVQLGVRGTITDGWKYDVTAQRSENSTTQKYLNFTSLARSRQALQVTTDGSGNPVCIDPSGGCVPLDLFNYLAITPDAANFIRADGLEDATTAEQVATASVTGDLGRYNLRLPWAKQGVQFAGGVEYRRNSLDFLPDAGIRAGDTTNEGGAVPAVNGRFNVSDAFAELQVPVIQDRPFIQDLTLDAAYRFSKYRIATRESQLDTHTYKFGVRYAPDSNIALRASWNRSVRAPDIQELFFPATVTVQQAADPCAGTTPNATLEDCQNTGVTPAEYGNIAQCASQQCNVRIGGNLNLKPEESITRQLGVVVTPQFLKGFTATVDYYDIVLTGAIGAIPPLAVLGSCLRNGEFCDKIQRGNNGILFGDPTQAFIDATDVNTGFLRSRGLDVNLNYDSYLSDLGLGDNGRVTLNLNGTYVSDFKHKDTPTSPQYNCAGLFGPVCGVPSPRWRHQSRLTWENPMGVMPGFAASLQWRYIGKTSLDFNHTDNPQLNPTGSSFDGVDAAIPGISYFDLAATYQLPFENQDVSVRFGVNNVTNRNPPVITLVGLPLTTVFAPPSNTFASLYDTLGRVFFVGIHANFN